MAIMFPIGNGNWSNAANWDSDDAGRVGTTPTVGDTVYLNAKTIVPDIDIDVDVISSAAYPALGVLVGGFLSTFVGNRIIKALLRPGWAASAADMLRANLSPNQELTLIGGVLNEGGGYFCRNNSVVSGVINIYGDCVQNNLFFDTPGTGEVNIYGNVEGTSVTAISVSGSPNSIKFRIFGAVKNSPSGQAIVNNNTTVPVEILGLVHNETNLGGHIGGKFSFMEGGYYLGKDLNENPLMLTDPSTTDQAPTNKVVEGTVYNNGGMTGTFIVPPKELVSLGTPVGDEVGEAILTAEAVAQAAAQVVGAQFNAFKW